MDKQGAHPAHVAVVAVVATTIAALAADAACATSFSIGALLLEDPAGEVDHE